MAATAACQSQLNPTAVWSRTISLNHAGQNTRIIIPGEHLYGAIPRVRLPPMEGGSANEPDDVGDVDQGREILCHASMFSRTTDSSHAPLTVLSGQKSVLRNVSRRNHAIPAINSPGIAARPSEPDTPIVSTS